MMININQKLTYKEAEAPQRNFFLQKATIEVKQFIKHPSISAYPQKKWDTILQWMNLAN